MQKVAVIMAGGRGERLWPKSRVNSPKQFLSLGGSEGTLIESTVKRMETVTDIKNVYIVTGEDYYDITREQLPNLPEENIISEPMAKNTAACIGYACQIIKKKYGEAMVMVVPSDHLINDVKAFGSDMNKCCDIAEKNNTIVTIGIPPTKPETGFGYIKVDKKRPIDEYELAWKMGKFVEKPDIKTAKRYLASEKYLWNAGMFAFPVNYMLKCLKRYHPHNYSCISKIGTYLGKKNEKVVISQMFDRMESISIDYAVMEKVRGSITVEATFDWNDIGTWAAIPEVQNPDDAGNYVSGGLVSALDSKGCIVEMSSGKAVALLGVSDLVVVESGNALLVCHKDYAQRIKEATRHLSEHKEYL